MSFDSLKPQPLVPHNLHTALFRIEVWDGNGGFFDGYTFPLSPSNVKRTYVGMGNHWDVQSPPGASGTGVVRQIDWYGNSAPSWHIEGTTGYQQPKNGGAPFGPPLTDGVTSATILNTMLNNFAVQNAGIIADGGANLWKMRFLDYYRQDFWEVSPLGEQIYMMDVQRPLLVNYRFHLVGVNDLAGAVAPLPDNLAAVFTQTALTAAQATIDLITAIATVQNPVTNLIGLP